MTFAEREAQAVAAVRWLKGPVTPAVLARVLNQYRGTPCGWCPVLPPKRGERCATVPAASARRCGRVIARLVGRGVLMDSKCGRRAMYMLA